MTAPKSVRLASVISLAKDSAMNNDWCNPESWNSSTLAYSEKSDVLYFDSTAEYETAVYAIAIPEGARSFSMFFKAGNSRSAAKSGAEDVGYITVSGETAVIAKTEMIKNNTDYVLYTLGSKENAIPVQGGRLYIKAEAYNSYKNSIDFYFGDIEVNFYETVPDEIFASAYFNKEKTTEKVHNLNGKSAVLPLAAAILLGAMLIISFLNTRKAKHNENPKNP